MNTFRLIIYIVLHLHSITKAIGEFEALVNRWPHRLWCKIKIQRFKFEWIGCCRNSDWYHIQLITAISFSNFTCNGNDIVQKEQSQSSVTSISHNDFHWNINWLTGCQARTAFQDLSIFFIVQFTCVFKFNLTFFVTVFWLQSKLNSVQIGSGQAIVSFEQVQDFVSNAQFIDCMTSTVCYDNFIRKHMSENWFRFTINNFGVYNTGQQFLNIQINFDTSTFRLMTSSFFYFLKLFTSNWDILFFLGNSSTFSHILSLLRRFLS